jgi:hypothetical protein
MTPREARSGRRPYIFGFASGTELLEIFEVAVDSWGPESRCQRLWLTGLEVDS